jgi:hypothetical protein
MAMAWPPASLVHILEAADDPHDDAPLRLPSTSGRSCSPAQEIILSVIFTDIIDQGMQEENHYLLCLLSHGKQMWLAAGLFLPLFVTVYW